MRPLAVLLALFLLPTVSLADATGTADRVDAFLRAEMDRNRIPGAAVAVLRDGKLVKLATYGTANLETGAPVTADTRFQIASATKLFTSALLMDLVDEGKVGLDDPVTRYLPQAPPAWSAITVRQLASHASGMARVPPNPSLRTMDEALSAAMKLPLATRPGETNAYGSDDFTVLAAVLEKAGGAPYPQLLKQRVLEPLGLARSAFDNARLDPPHVVLTYDELPGRAGTYEWKAGTQQRYAFLYPSYTYAAGGLFSSIGDMAAFVGGVLDGKLFGAKALQEMWTPVALAGGKPGGFATGWTVASERGRRKLGHSGGPALADVAVYPDQSLAVVVLTNQRKLYPTLASAVARFYLPDNGFTGRPALPDPNPARTASHLALVHSLMLGKAEAGSFAAALHPDLPEINEWIQLRTGGYAPPRLLELLEDAASSRTYRSTHGDRGSLLWRFDADADGRIRDVEVNEE